MHSLRRSSSVNGKSNLRVTKQALELMHLAAEMKLIRLLEDAYMCTLHAKRVTLMYKDINLIKKLNLI